MIFPRGLKKGDQVGIVAIADSVSYEKIKPGLDLIKSWGLNPVVGRTVGIRHHQMAGTDQERAQDLQAQLDNPNIRAIFMARGGYGTVRIVDRLDFTEFKKNPKWVVGYSDITALHAHLQHLGYVSIHAEMPAFITEKSPESAASLKTALFAAPPKYGWPSNALNTQGMASGELIGGNMSILYSLCGSRTAPCPAGKLLFMEDLGEYLYHVDRMMQNFKRNGWFEQLSGLIIGGFNKMKDNEVPFGQTVPEIIKAVTKDYDFPVAFDFPAGHCYDNRSLLFGAQVTLEVASTGCELTYKMKV